MAGKTGHKKRIWFDDEKRSICMQTLTSGVSAARVAHRYSMNANLIFKGLKDPRFAPIWRRMLQSRTILFSGAAFFTAVSKPVPPVSQCGPAPIGKRTEFPTPGITLWLRCKRPSLALQNDHVAGELDQKPEMTAADRCVLPSATKATTRLRSASGCDLPICHFHIYLKDRDSQIKRFGYPESNKPRRALKPGPNYQNHSRRIRGTSDCHHRLQIKNRQ